MDDRRVNSRLENSSSEPATEEFYPHAATRSVVATVLRGKNLLHLLLVAVAIPAALAAANHIILVSQTSSSFVRLPIVPLFAFYVAQIGLMSWLSARFVQPWQLRCIVYAWIMVLIDLQLAILTTQVNHEGLSCLSTAIFTSQISVATVWAILPRGRWLYRSPAIVIMGLVYLHFYSSLVGVAKQSNRFDWNELFSLQLVILSLMCLGLRLRGFSLTRTDETDVRSGNNAGNGAISRARQFSIRDVLIGTTLLAALMGAAKAGDLLTMQFLEELYVSGFLFILVIAITSAAVSILALWAALGQGKLFLRVILPLFLPLVFGSAVTGYCFHLQQTIRRGGRTYWAFHRWYETGYWWIGWMFLIGALLAASLIIYRTLGYRLIRFDQNWKGRTY